MCFFVGFSGLFRDSRSWLRKDCGLRRFLKGFIGCGCLRGICLVHGLTVVVFQASPWGYRALDLRVDSGHV